jgi:hypothetical protein
MASSVTINVTLLLTGAVMKFFVFFEWMRAVKLAPLRLTRQLLLISGDGMCSPKSRPRGIFKDKGCLCRKGHGDDPVKTDAPSVAVLVGTND